MTPTLDQRAAEARELLERATGGEWFAHNLGGLPDGPYTYPLGTDSDKAAANAALIAAAVNLLPDLLAERDQLRAVADAAQSHLRRRGYDWIELDRDKPSEGRAGGDPRKCVARLRSALSRLDSPTDPEAD